MKKHKNLIFYSTVISIAIIIIYIITHLGRVHLEGTLHLFPIEGKSSAWANFTHSFLGNITHPLAILLLQIVTILLAVRTFGWICQKINQPAVVGEILAGVLLGPSLLGYYFPEISNFLFPLTSLGNINFLSQIGLILFMFIVGLELDLKTIKGKVSNACIISHSSIAITFTFGFVVAYLIFDEFASENTHFLPFALFMGVAMSIAAFPVMARIVHERGLNKTPLGLTIITCAAVDDITAWCLLAAVIAITKAGSFTSSIFVILMAISYVIVMFKIIRPFLKMISDLKNSRRIVSKSIIGIYFIVLFLSAYATEIIGIHALFGAFLAGVIIPSNKAFRDVISEKIEDVALVLLLPLFFVFTGLRTEIGLLNEPHLWIICGGIIFLAVMGKFWGSALAAKFVGNSWKDSLTIGALMDTRGLMELVILNIGLDLGILPPKIFAMMVVMALATTFLTSPVLNLINWVYKSKKSSNNEKQQKKYRILVSFDDTEMGRKLLFIANCFIRKHQTSSELTMLHLTEGHMLHQHSIEEEAFGPVINEANTLNQNIVPVSEVANELSTRVAKYANKGNFDLLLIGTKSSPFETKLYKKIIHLTNRVISIPKSALSRFKSYKKWKQTLDLYLDKHTRAIVCKTNIPVGIFIDKGTIGIRNVFVPIIDVEDIFMGGFLERLAENSYVNIILWDAIGLSDTSIDFIQSIRATKAVNPYLFQLWNINIHIDTDILDKQDLMIISMNSWKKLDEMNVKWLKNAPSTLVLNN